jgi:hypothetical protein
MPQFMTIWTPRGDTPHNRFVPERLPDDGSAEQFEYMIFASW